MDALLSPSLGTMVWASIAFIIVLIILRRAAWGPILKGLKEREESIAESLNEAEKARQDIADLKSDNEKLLQEARVERDNILKEARELKDSMIADAKNQAKEEAEKMVNSAREAIETEKAAALADLKEHVAMLSLEIAEKVVRQSLSSDDSQKALVDKLLQETDLN
ncbi:MAG: F0F1 ATP synthase subunit B [Flavobacteriales bacterium]|uniref:F0F1 ATP synthase subunit B n=1 Tax=Sanyastnella coralliicola TaxID=3069118 RepID=UPI0027B8BCBD|nr:F0F1 ATP synthase subunit B [Longitalea sp. SCSIO 12813]MCH2197268.1 F0F1 ATP synthase subunit B [Flavobacteriales bacterium]